MQIENLNVVTRKVICRQTGLPYYEAVGTGEIRKVIGYGPTRTEAFCHAVTLIKEQGIKPTLEAVK